MKRLSEGGAMPGVGAIHIDEIEPTLKLLQSKLGIDLENNVLGSVGKRQFSGDIDVALNIPADDIPAFVEKLKAMPEVLDLAKSSVIMTKIKIEDFDKSKSDGRPRTGYVQVDFMPGDPGWLKTYYHSPSETESKYKGVYRNIMIASIAAVYQRKDSDEKIDDGRSVTSERWMWSPTDGLIRIRRTPVPKKSGDGYTKKNSNEKIIDPIKDPKGIAKALGLDGPKDLNSFETLWNAVKKNYPADVVEKIRKGFEENGVIKDAGIPPELNEEFNRTLELAGV
jgi:hypothetical protein